MFFKRLFLLSLLSIQALTWYDTSVTAKTQSTNSNIPTKKRPPPPKRIPPNKVKPGGGLDSIDRACANHPESVSALVPINNPVITTQLYPSFLFYVPDKAKEIYGEFSLLTADDKTLIYKTSVTFGHTPAIIKINLPSSSQYALEEGNFYHWYLKIHCQNPSNSQVSLYLDGWIQRVLLTPERAAKLENASPDIWYDSIAMTAENLLNSPENSILRDRWYELLQHIDLEHFSGVPIVETFGDRYTSE